MATPNTIIITNLPNAFHVDSLPSPRLPAPTKMMMSDSEDADSCPARKRQRLDHLTHEEKIMRRKLKNRVAAQSARDRKKAHMQDLEEEVRILETKSKKLLDENLRLHTRNEQLEKENADLRLKLGIEAMSNIAVKQEPKDSVNIPESSIHRSVEYASLISDPLLKGQDQLVAALWMMHCVGWLMLNLMSLLMFYNNSRKNLVKIPIHPMKEEMKRSVPLANPVLSWWGPQQKNWNPSKN